MSENLHNIDKLFKAAIDGQEEAPSDRVWENIDKELEDARVAPLNKKYPFVRLVAAALIGLVIIAGVYALQAVYTNPKLGVRKPETDSHSGNSSPVTIKQKSPSENHTHVNKGEEVKEPQKILVPVNSTASEIGQNDITVKHDILKKAEKTGEQSNTETGNEKGLRNQLINNKTFKKEERQNVAFNFFPENKRTAIPSNKKRKSPSRPSVLPDSFVATTSNRWIVPSSLAALQNHSLISSLPFKEMYPVKGIIHPGRPKTFPFSITVFFSPDFVSNRLEGNQHDFREDDKNEIKQREESAFSFTTGLLGSYKLARNWSLQSGLMFSKSVTHIEPKTIYARYDNNGRVRYRFNSSAGYYYLPLQPAGSPRFGDSLNAFSSKQELQYITVPIALKYAISLRKIDLYPTAGIAANFLTSQRLETALENNPVREKTVINTMSGLKSGYLSGTLGLEMQYGITKRIALSVAPATRFALTAINKNTPVKSYPASFSIAGGLQFKL